MSAQNNGSGASDFVSGLDVDEATYRVTLRPRAGGDALATSNPVTVTWSQ